jgi:ribosomal protein S18 acetylase RimI-like enzyme
MEDPDDHRVLVVERSNEVIGSAELSWQSKGHTALPLALPKRFKQFMNQQRLVPYVSNVVIREDSRSRGYGSELLKAIEELVSLREEEHIYLHVNHQDTSAVNFYARLGYRPVQESDDMASKTGWLRRLVLLAVGLYFVDQPRSDYLSKHLKRSS